MSLELGAQKHPKRLSPENLHKLNRSIPMALGAMVREVTNGDMAYQLVGRINEVRVVFDPQDKDTVMVAVSCEGMHTQPFHVTLKDE